MKKHTLRLFFIRIVLTVLVISSIQLKAFAEELTSTKKVDETVVQTNSVEDTEPQVGELIDERTTNTKTFYNGDGKYTEKVYFEPVNMKEPGETNFEEISPDLVKDNTTTNIITTENTAIDTEFLKTMSNGKYANFSYKGHSLSLSILQAAGEDKTTLNASDVDAKFVENTNKIVHESIFPQIDLQNYTFNQNTKEDLVLHHYDGYHIFTFNIQTDLKATIDEDGNIQMKDDDDKKIFELPKPFMSDSNIDEGSGEAVTSDKVSYDIEEIDGGYKLTLNADPDWLASPERVFPVFIDPTTSVTDSSDTFVMSAYPTTNYSSTSSKWDSGLGAYILKIGNYDSTTGTCYAFLNQGLPANLTGLTITSASFNAYVKHSASSSATGIWLDRITGSWSNSSVTWDTKPSSTNIATTTVGEGQWANFDVTNTVKSWLNGSLTNYGLKLHENGNGSSYWKKIISTSNSDNNPYISVNYTIPTPDSPTGYAYSYGDSTNSGYVDLNWDAVPGATGYKVLIFNGNDYDEFSVGNVTSWSTKGRKIWPSPSEIASGIYTLHHVSTDGGVELPNDPSALYKKNGNKYPTNTNYWFRIKAIYPLGESAQSDPPFKPTIPNLKFAEMTSVNSFTRGTNGYIDLSWKPVTGATGYKFLMYNGKAFESLDIGNVTSWTTKDKKYWPKPTESYDLHLDNTKSGDELAIDPSIVYQKANPNYKPRYYVLKIVPYNANGETVQPAASYSYIPQIPVPSPPTGRAYTNLSQSNSGYVNLSWDKISGATGYKVWVYNGKDYESYDVGDVDSWTTQNKGIWPSQSEIDGGMKNLHHPTNPDDPNYGGVELPLEPSKLYAKNGTTYATSPYYYFRISAYNTQGETVYSTTYFRTVIGDAVPFLGIQDYWSYVDVPGGSVNTATGNYIRSENDFSLGGKGTGITIERTYNSQSTINGLFGVGWHSNLDESITLINNEAHYVDEDGTLLTFEKDLKGVYQPPTGVDLTLTDNGSELSLKDNSQITKTFDKTTGHIKSIEDGNHLKTTFNYTTNQLTSISDASNTKVVDVHYNADGHIDLLSLFSSRTINYEYNGLLLSKVTDPNNELTQYEYDSENKMTKVLLPVISTNTPAINIVYQDDQVASITDPMNKIYQLTYDSDSLGNFVKVQFPNDKINQYWYNADANPTRIKEDVGGKNTTTAYYYEGNRLKESYDPNDVDKSPTETYSYDTNGNTDTATSHYGTEDFEYDNLNNETSYTDTESKESSTVYDGVNAVSDNDISNSIAAYTKYDSFGNAIETSNSLSAATNLVTNGSFQSDLTGWTKIVTPVNDTGTISIDSVGKDGISGNKSIKFSPVSTSDSTGYLYLYQTINNIKENTIYTLSSDIKSDLTNVQAIYRFQFFNASGTSIGTTVGTINVSGKQEWINKPFSFKTPAGTTKVQVKLEVDHNSINGKGDVWFDSVQLEKSEFQSSYNPIENGGFENALTSWIGSGGTVDTAEHFDSSNSLKIVRSSSTAPTNEYKQTVLIGQKSDDQPIDLTLTGLSKATNVVVPIGGTKDSTKYALKAVINYTDGTNATITANFLDGTKDWNRAYTDISALASKPINTIDVSVVFGGNFTGTAWFDGIRIIKGKNKTISIYDTDGNYLIQTTDQANYSTKFEYDSFGNQTKVTDASPSQNVKQFHYDNADQLDYVTLANHTTIDYKYKAGLQTSKTINSSIDNLSQTYLFDYDDNGNLVKTTGPLNDATTNKYDDNGRLIESTLPSGTTISNTYDGSNRITSIAYNHINYYDFTYDGNGNQTEVDDALLNRTTTNDVIDTQNRITKKTITQGTASSVQTWLYPSDSDKLISTTFNQGQMSETTSYSYNNMNQNSIVSNGGKNFLFSYDELGNLRSYTAGNNSSTSYQYDNRNLIDTERIQLDNGSILLDESYEYDANGNRTKVNLPNNQAVVYTYDSLNQLTSEELPNGTKNVYSYDGFGNRTNVKETKDGATTETNSQFNKENQLTEYGNDPIHYDADGNRTDDGDYRYEWNPLGQLISVTKNGESIPFATYKYDEQGRRIEKTVDGVTTKYFYDGDSINVLYETDSTGAVLRSYIYSVNGQRLAMKTQGQLFYYHYNSHRDVIALTNQTGQIVASYEYDAWGNPLKTEETIEVKDNPYRFAGYQYDVDTGYYYLIARYYHPKQGVFLSLDPDPGKESDSITQNGYEYASNNPVRFFDPNGNRELPEEEMEQGEPPLNYSYYKSESNDAYGGYYKRKAARTTDYKNKTGKWKQNTKKSGVTKANTFFRSPKNAKQVIKYLEKKGFEAIDQEGSHVKLGKGSRRVTVPWHGAKDLPIGTLQSIRKQAGL
ncbi:DNRLRE domain-containing protein [Bacillus sp. UNCCL81]|uniref:DNRLRE domain-containing protein n=1 Tax=Bacillus sp. UNCCL81 TaxID=1502755 RepID=UPI0008E7D149|nr:DNRLRE domain-containing protein [Bacillus sp. UNCCL81]SFD61059.1 RHS repeat-associated core domain-containing protein [Bacillus sp. UNCCL81]